MRKILLVLLAGLLIFTLSCQKTQKEKEAEKAMKSLEQFGRALKETSNKIEETKGKIEAVDFRLLKKLLPDLKGWEKQNSSGERSAFGGFGISTAQAEYVLGESKIELKITDPAGYYMFIAPFITFIQSGFEEEDENHYKKSSSVKGYPAIEEFYPQEKRGSLTVIVKNRFLVEAEGENISKIDFLFDLLNNVDLKKLETL
ncbi:MAG: hypothetical protein ACUVUG_06140 [Candidatus Aminicenantia bacterium]